MERLFHGTDLDSAIVMYKAQSVDVKIGSVHTDFGQGFYTTDDYETARRWAVHKAVLRGKRPAVVSVYLNLTVVDQLAERFQDDLRWGRFIINNRNGRNYINRVSFKEHNLDARFSVTYGRISDIEVRDVAKELASTGELLMSLDRILNISYPFQYAFHTEEAAGLIKKITYSSV